MKKQIMLVIACVATSIQAFAAMEAFTGECSTNCFGFESAILFDVGGGYRQDSLSWKTFPSSAPGTVVHEKWKNISMGVVEVGAQILACEHFLFRADFDYGLFDQSGHQKIQTFTTSTTTLTSENPVTLTSDLSAKTKGHTYDISGALGYQFDWCCCRYALTPMAGYSYHFQKFVNKKYENLLLPTEADLIVHNKYRFRWSGPFLGFSTAYQITCDWQLAFSYLYHWAKYHADVTENFTLGALTGHQHSHDVTGNEINVSTAYEFCENWVLALNYNYKTWSGNKGKFTNNTFTSDLRKISWNTWSGTIDVAYLF